MGMFNTECIFLGLHTLENRYKVSKCYLDCIAIIVLTTLMRFAYRPVSSVLEVFPVKSSTVVLLSLSRSTTFLFTFQLSDESLTATSNKTSLIQSNIDMVSLRVNSCNYKLLQ